MSVRKRAPRWYFSLRSPYSWFAYRDLMDSRPDVLDKIEWIPFWEPDTVTQQMLDAEKIVLTGVPMTRAKNFYILQDTRRLAKERGFTDITWPIDRDPVWEVSHLAWIIANDAGKGKEFVAAAYRARWTGGKNISDPAVIAEVAEEIGLDGPTLAGAVDDPELRKRGVELLDRSARDGLFGVPFFIHKHDKFWGVDRVKQFVAAVDEAMPPVESTPDDPSVYAEILPAGGDAGHAGGCG